MYLLELFSLNILSRFTFAGPGRLLASPGWQGIPFGPTHPALFASDPHENKGRIIPARFRTNENCWNPVGIPDDSCVRHFRLLPPGLKAFKRACLRFDAS